MIIKKSIKMSNESLELQKTVCYMFKNYEVEEDIEKLKNCKRILKIMRDNLSKYDDEYMEDGNEYMIYDMGKNYIDEDRWWIYEYEIDVYEEIINVKIDR